MTDFETQLRAQLEDAVAESVSSPDLAAVFEAAANVGDNTVSVVDLSTPESPNGRTYRSYPVLMAAAVLVVVGGLVFTFGPGRDSDDTKVGETATAGLPAEGQELSASDEAELDALVEFHDNRLGLISVIEPIGTVGDMMQHTDAVVGTVVEIRPGSAFVDADESGTEEEASMPTVEVDFDDPAASWRTFLLVVDIEEVIGNTINPKPGGYENGRQALIGVAVPNIELANAYKHLGRSVFFIHESSMFASNPDTLSLGYNGTWLATLDRDTEQLIDFPLANKWPNADGLLAAEPSLEDLRRSASESEPGDVTTSIEGTSWILIDEEPGPELEAYVYFHEDSTVMTLTGCNGFTSTYEITEQTVKIGRAGPTTLMGCEPFDKRTTFDSWFRQSTHQIDLSADGTRLTLSGPRDAAYTFQRINDDGDIGSNLDPLADGCATLTDGDIVESATFTPYEDRRGPLVRLPIVDPSRPAPVMDEFIPVVQGKPVTAIDGLELQYTTGETNSSLGIYGQRPIGVDETYDDAITTFIFLRQSTAGNGQATQQMLNSPILSGRVVEIKIGASQGAIGWADPLADGTRPHNLSWSTDDTDYNISADLPAEQLANIARTLACQPASD